MTVPGTSSLLLLDTSIVLALMRANAFGRHLHAEYLMKLDDTTPALIAAGTPGEAMLLAKTWNWPPARVEELGGFFREVVVLDIREPAVVAAYVSLKLGLRKAPGGSQENRGDNDCWIAACGIAAGAALLTADRDFLAMSHPDLTVFYADPQPFRRSVQDPSP